MATLIDSSVLIAAERRDLISKKLLRVCKEPCGTSTSPLPVIAVVKLEGFIYSDFESMNILGRSMKAKVEERGQVTIPKPLRERLGVKAGTVLDFTEENGRLIAVKAAPADTVSAVYGCLGKPFDTDAFIRGIRGKI